jgi:hypothetical protein
MSALHLNGNETRFELRFESLRDAGSACSFPCDAAGHVDMDDMAQGTLNRYLFARAVIGCEFAMPRVCRVNG